MTATLAPPSSERRLVLDNTSWDYYLRTIEEYRDSHVRVNYYRGAMEIFMPGVKHERVKKAIARLLETYSLEARVRISGLGSVTCIRENVRAGIEPDECFYITTPLPKTTPNVLDLAREPRPDLAVEVDVSSSSVSRESIYADFGIPEIWRFDGQRIWPNIRQPNGTYQSSSSSEQLPKLPLDVFSKFVLDALSGDPYDAAVAFQEWIRKQKSS